MPWNDDSWRDSYDSWKLSSPDEYDDPCDHEDYEIDVLDGRARCDRCGESWYATDDEILRQIDNEAAYNAHMELENRKQWWRDLWSRIRSFVYRREPYRRPYGPTLDDDIPF